MIRRILFGLVSYSLVSSLSASTVWNGPNTTFTKPDNADWTQEANQDRMTSDVWITRADTQGIFNIAPGFETSFTHSFSPQNTQWASGLLANYASLTYQDWNTWAKVTNPGPPSTVGVDAVVHLISQDVYMSIKFISFSGPGGGFAYQRSTAPTSTWSGAAADGKWSTAGNWDAAPGFGSNLIFAAAGNSPVPTNDSNLTSVGSITFNSGASAFVLGGTGTGATVGVSGGLTNNSTSAQTINLRLNVFASQQFNAANGSLTINGAIAVGGKALTTAGSSPITLAGAISGTGSLTKNGTANAIVSGNNSYSGGTNVNSGTLVVAHVNALGTGGLSINNTATAQVQVGLTAPVQLSSLTIAGNQALAADAWLNGDFDYGGIVDNTTDLGSAYQGSPLTGAGDSVSTALPVPEPSTWLLAVFGLLSAVFLLHPPKRTFAKAHIKRF